MVFIRVADPGRFLTDTGPDDEKNLIWAPMRFYTHKLKMQPQFFSPFISITKSWKNNKVLSFQVITRAF